MIVLKILKKYCSGSHPSAQMNLDTTFKCGDFLLAVMTLKHPIFVHSHDQTQHPGIVAAIATITTKPLDDYKYIASQLTTCGVKTLTYITDGETAMEAGRLI